MSSSISLIGNNKERQEVSQQKCVDLLMKISAIKKIPPYSSPMSMEVKLNSMGGEGALSLFWGGGA